MKEKQQLRKVVMSELAKISLPTYEDLSFQIAKRFYEDVYWKNASLIAITISKVPEVDTLQLIRKAWEQGKKVVVPKCEHKSRKLDFRELTRFSQLESGYFGLYEPIESETKSVDANEIQLVVVPGLAFSRNGSRLGFGGGYYDRFLENYQGNTVSLAFQQQLIPELPTEAHDKVVKKIITEAEIILSGA